MALRCGHTERHPERNSETRYYYELDAQFPLVLFVEGERARVQADPSARPEIRAGSALIAIDDTPMAVLIAQLTDRVPFAEISARGIEHLIIDLPDNEENEYIHHANLRYGAILLLMLGCIGAAGHSCRVMPEEHSRERLWRSPGSFPC